MDIRITPSQLYGGIEAPASKSDAHRLLICSALADKPTVIDLDKTSTDIDATIECMRAMGASIEYKCGEYIVEPIKAPPERPLLDCKESGSTLRFLLPVASVVCGGARFLGGGRLPERPLEGLIEVMESGGVLFSGHRLPFEMKGRLNSGAYEIAGDVSSQYISGLMLALPLASGDSRIILTSRLESAAYVDMTLHAQRRFGVIILKNGNALEMEGGQRYRSPDKAAVEGDWSNAAFFLTAGALGGPVTVKGLAEDSVQGDSAVEQILRDFGASAASSGGSVKVSARELSGRTVDVSAIPDLLPILAVAAAFAEGETRFVNAARLRLKESDRLRTTASMLTSLGGGVTELDDGLLVRGGGLTGGETESFGDHRIAMAASIAAAYSKNPTTIRHAEAVRKSYPTFFEDFAKLGGRYEEI